MNGPEQGQIVKRETGAQLTERAKDEAPTVAPMVADQEAYVRGFDGMATSPFAAPAIAILREPIDPNDVEIKPDGICYLPGMFYRQRLNRAFGPGAWALPPRGAARRMPKSGGELVVFHGALFVLGRFVSERMGECMYYPSNGGMTYADAYEGAVTNCLARCCKDIMPGVEVLWDKGWRDEWTRKYCETYEGKNGKTEWRRKSSLRTSKMSPSATPPTNAPFAGAAATAPNAANGASSSAPSAPPAPESTPKVSDAEPLASDAQLDALEKLAFDELRFTHDYAGRWLFTTFGTRDPSKLTAKQAEDGLAKLREHGPLKAGA